jgi:long-chain acyl-CoA synthetase
MMNLVELIFGQADRGATALMAGDRAVAFGELERMVGAAAEALRVPPLARVGLNCPNGVAHVVWALAILKRGAILVPVAPELSGRERDELLATTGLHAVLSADGKKWHRELGKVEAVAPEGVGEAGLLITETPCAVGFDESELAELNPALIRFSSGTTGKRKGVVLSHETLLERVRASNVGPRFGPGDRVIWILPMAHHFAVSIVLYLLHGATTVIEESHLGEDVFGALARHRGTALYASPFHYALLSGCAAAGPVDSLRLAVSTAAALPLATATAFGERFGLPLTQAMGIIECGLPIYNGAAADRKAESVGRPQAAYSVSIRDAGGEDVGPKGEGELFLKGPGFVDAYLSPWMRREAILEAGWFRAGDQALRDEEGDIYLVGRTHSAINVGGMKCFPEEVEGVLNEHPKIRESRVIGQPHPTFGSVPVAEVVAADPSEPPKTIEILSHCRARLSSYKLPMKIQIVPSVPKTPSGKIQR